MKVVNNILMRNFFIKNKYEKGFTLIELMVATSLFAIVAVAGVSILLSSQRAYKRVSNNRVAIDNTNLVIDSISREVKFGRKYGCVNTSTGPYVSWNDNLFNYLSFSSTLLTNEESGFCNALAFTPETDEDRKIVYYLDSNAKAIHQAEYIFNVTTSAFDLDKDYILTSNDFIVNNFWIKVSGISVTDYKQPSVHIYMSGIVNLVKDNQGIVTSTSTFAIETYLSQRSIDN